MKINEIKKELGISNKDIAGFFDMEYFAYANSTAKKRYETALCRFYAFCKKASGEGKENKTSTVGD
jgi:hypothetical protein